MTQSFDYCTLVMAQATDGHLAEGTSMFRRATGRSRAEGLVTIASDWTGQHSTAASYLRLDGIVPPSARAQH